MVGLPSYPVRRPMAAAGAVPLVALRETVAAERSRWALWIPVLLGVGIALYFALDREPAAWAGPAALAAALGAAVALRRRLALQIVAWAAVIVAAGFSAAQIRTALVAAPILAKRTPPVAVEGRIRRIEIRAGGVRLWLDRLGIAGLAPLRTPERVRITLRRADPELRPGDRVALRAVLYPPPAPAAPGAFDFARRAFFARLGGVGFAIGPARRRAGEAQGTLTTALAALRDDLTARIRAALPGPAGGMAAALMTGERGAIPEDVLAAMRDSGLAHLLAISGLHLGLVGGLLFFAVRLLLATCEGIALGHPIKKWAAAAALLGAFGYLLISGATLPTQRAFLMLALVLAAVMIDRLPISMNLVAWAAAAILIAAPESLLSVSFQMSFAAVVALVAVYESPLAQGLLHGGAGGAGRKAAAYVGAVLLTTLVAGAATAPFAAYHFNRVALYGLLANLAAIPLTALWIMPWAVAAFVLMPFAAEKAALAPMGWGIEGVIAVAEWIQGLPGAVALVPAMPAAGLALIAAGGLWLCLWRRRWRWLGLVPCVAGLASLAVVRPPDILVDGAFKLVAVQDGDGRLVVSRRRAGFTGETWLRRAGQKESAPWPRTGPGAGGRLRCDRLGCIYRAAGHRVALVRERAALDEDCAVATVVISRVPVRRGRCRGPQVVIDRFRLWREGAHALWLAPGAVRIESVGQARGVRPWSLRPARRRRAMRRGGR